MESMIYSRFQAAQGCVAKIEGDKPIISEFSLISGRIDFAGICGKDATVERTGIYSPRPAKSILPLSIIYAESLQSHNA